MTSTPLSSTPPLPPAPARLTIRTPEDVLAAVPVVLGFEPQESIAMLTFGGRETFHARVDLPPPDRPGELAEAIGLLVEPARHHGVTGVVLVVYSRHALLARRAARVLSDTFDETGIHVVEVLRADGRRWFADGRRGESGRGVAYDAGAHRFRVESVLRGHVVHGSREELARLLDTLPEAAARVADLVGRSAPLPVDEVGSLVARCLPVGRFDDAELAALLVTLHCPGLRDGAWSAMVRADADDHVRLWTDAVQRAPDELVGGPAAVLALAAWLAGHGALAWCAVDRCRGADPGNTLARLVGDLLAGAVPPQSWETDGHGVRP